jgi:DNA polymerase III sliding clamp (beta) subunit (PCNA family)
MNKFTKNQLLIGKVSSKDSTRPALNGILLEGKKAVATNGHVLIINENLSPDSEWPEKSVTWSDSAESFILPTSAVKKALQAFPKITKWDKDLNDSLLAIGETETGVTIQNTDNDRIETKKEEGRFPNYQQVMPDTTGYLEVCVDASYLKTICEIMEKSEGKGVILKINPNDSHNNALVLENRDQSTEIVTAVLMYMRMK